MYKETEVQLDIAVLVRTPKTGHHVLARTSSLMSYRLYCSPFVRCHPLLHTVFPNRQIEFAGGWVGYGQVAIHLIRLEFKKNVNNVIGAVVCIISI